MTRLIVIQLRFFHKMSKKAENQVKINVHIRTLKSITIDTLKQ